MFFKNINPSQLQKWAAAAAGVRLGLSNATMAFVGDSITALALNPGGPASTYSYAFPEKIGTILTNFYGLDCSPQCCIGDHNLTNIGMSLATYDPRISFGTGWSNEFVSTANYGLCATNFYNGTTTNALAFTPTIQTDTMEWFYIDGLLAGSSIFTLDIDGGTPVSTSIGTPTSNMLSTTISGTLGSHTYNAKRVSGNVNGIGFVASNSAIKSVRLFNLGCCGWKASDWALSAYGSSPLNALAALQPDITILMLGGNEILSSPIVPIETYISNMQPIITAAKVSGDVLIMFEYQLNPAEISECIQDTYRQAAQELAAYNNCGFVDLNELFVSFAAASGAVWMADSNHPGEPIRRIIAWELAKVLGGKARTPA